MANLIQIMGCLAGIPQTVILRYESLISQMLNKTTSYAIQALAYISSQGKDREFVPMNEIADTLSIPYHFLKKILADLSQHGLLNSHRSSKGGVALARDSRKITLFDIIELTEGSLVFSSCILGLPGCGEATPCALHNAWAVERNRLSLLFSSTTIADVSNRVEEKGFRISP